MFLPMHTDIIILEKCFASDGYRTLKARGYGFEPRRRQNILYTPLLLMHIHYVRCEKMSIKISLTARQEDMAYEDTFKR